MNLSRSTAFAVAAILHVAAACGAEQEKPAEVPKRVIVPEKPITLAAPEAADRVQLGGKWEGAEVGAEESGPATLTVAGNTMHFEGAKKGEWYKATFTLSAETEPKQLRATIADCPRPEMVGLASTAIFKLEQGKLTLAGYKPGSNEVPKNFEPAAGLRVFEFKKATDPAK